MPPTRPGKRATTAADGGVLFRLAWHRVAKAAEPFVESGSPGDLYAALKRHGVSVLALPAVRERVEAWQDAIQFAATLAVLRHRSPAADREARDAVRALRGIGPALVPEMKTGRPRKSFPPEAQAIRMHYENILAPLANAKRWWDSSPVFTPEDAPPEILPEFLKDWLSHACYKSNGRPVRLATDRPRDVAVRIVADLLGLHLKDITRAVSRRATAYPKR